MCLILLLCSTFYFKVSFSVPQRAQLCVVLFCFVCLKKKKKLFLGCVSAENVKVPQLIPHHSASVGEGEIASSDWWCSGEMGMLPACAASSGIVSFYNELIRWDVTVSQGSFKVETASTKWLILSLSPDCERAVHKQRCTGCQALFPDGLAD